MSTENIIGENPENTVENSIIENPENTDQNSNENSIVPGHDNGKTGDHIATNLENVQTGETTKSARNTEATIEATIDKRVEHIANEGIDRQKQLVRAIARSARKALTPEDRQTQSLLICTHIIRSLAWAEASTVLTYLSAGSEVDLDGLFPLTKTHRNQTPRSGDALGPQTLAAPIMEGENIRFATVVTGIDGSPLVRVGEFGLREPIGLPVDLSDVGLVLVPLLAFDKHGNRLGSGKGFYDRFLAANPELTARATIIGVAFEAQRLPSIPVEPHDFTLDAVVTELGIQLFNR
jgi:5-formyltetrahydrofolate cyclo-ligase